MTETAVVPQTHRSEPTTYWLGLAGLIVLVLACYWPSMRGAFIWDDDFYVTNNLALKTSEGIEQIWLHNPRGGVLPAHDYPVPQFYPMTITSFWAQTRGQDWIAPPATWPFHLINVLLHIASAWLLWTILRRLQVPGAFVAAAIWALHPVQVESVAWITERKNVLSGFFYFASMLIYLRFAGLDAPALGEERGTFSLPAEKFKLYALALVLFIFAILSKSVTGSLPAVILLLIWWKRGKITESDVWPLVPFFVLAIAMGATTSYFERNVVGAQGPDWAFSAGQRILIASGAVWFYVIKLVCPIDLAFVYPKWDLHSPLLVAALASGIVVIALLAAFHRRIGRGPLVIALLFAGTLFPALGFINVFPMRYSFVADHFQYLAGAAVIAGGVWCLHRFFSTPTRFAVASGLILGALCAMTWAQNHLYTSPAILWADTLQKNPNSWIAHNNLGVIELGNDKLDDAEKQFNEALELKPEYVEAMMNLGLIQQKRGDLPGAIDWMIRAITAAQSDPIHEAGYAQVYFQLGSLRLEQGDRPAAMQAFLASYSANHHYLPALNGVGEMYYQMGKTEGAKLWFQKAIELDPLFLLAHVNLGSVLLDEGDVKGALDQWEFVIQRDRNNVSAIYNIGRFCAIGGQWDQAIKMFNRALEIQPDFEAAQRGLAAALRHKHEAATQAATMRSTTQPATAP